MSGQKNTKQPGRLTRPESMLVAIHFDKNRERYTGLKTPEIARLVLKELKIPVTLKQVREFADNLGIPIEKSQSVSANQTKKIEELEERIEALEQLVKELETLITK